MKLIPVDHDPFAGAPTAGITLTPIDHDPFAGEAAAPAASADAPSTAGGLARSFGSGVVDGIAATPGFIGDMGREVMLRATHLGDRIRQAAGFAPNDPAAMAELEKPLPGTTAFNKSLVESVTGPLHKPEGRAEQYAHTLGEFAPGALGSPGGPVAKTLGVVLPALASETAGQVTAGTSLEAPARIAGGLIAGGAHALATAPSTAERLATRSLARIPEAERDAALAHAQRLLDDAREMGIPLSTANAIDTATGGATGLSDLQRHVEAMGRMKPFYAEMPDAVDRAGRATFDTIAPPSAMPSGIGPAASRAAQSEIADTQAGINAATRPAYMAAEGIRIGPDVHGALMGDPLYARTLAQVRGDPTLNRTIASLPDDSVGVVDLVQRRLREQAESARAPGQATTSNLAAANLEDARSAPIAAAETATGSRAATATTPAIEGTYEAARAQQQQLREERLRPLLDGPLGKIADKPETKAAIDALFPANPTPNSAGEVRTAVHALVRRNPHAASDLVRTHMEGVFNEATQALQSGPNPMGGAKFAASLRGNPQQAENLDAAVRALPSGNVLADGLNRFLDVLEAGGRRQNVGAKTAYNAQDLASLGKGGATEGFAKMLATGGIKLPSKTLATLEEWRQGKNLDRLADLFTRADAVPAVRALVNAPNPAPYIAHLVALSARGKRSGDAPRQP